MHWRRRPRSPLISTTLALVATSAPAQGQPPQTDGLWRGTGGASFSAVSGNSTSTTLGLSHSSNNRPPAGTGRSDSALLAGLSLRFGAD